mgnify:CR=1 FL=1
MVVSEVMGSNMKNQAWLEYVVDVCIEFTILYMQDHNPILVEIVVIH